MSVAAILKAQYPDDVVDALLAAYREIELNYFLGKWKASELDAGHFVEAARRMLEHTLLGSHTPIGTDLPKFHEGVLKKYEAGTGDDALRLLIPRLLWVTYGIRNKRGVGHVGSVSPNHMDSALILGNVKWVLAEFVRLASGLSVAETQELVESIVERRLHVLWKHGDITRVLDSGVPARDQVLLLLYDKSPQKADDLKAAVEYSNPTKWKAILKKLHKDRFIEYRADGTCIITPKGVLEAEEITSDGKLVA